MSVPFDYFDENYHNLYEQHLKERSEKEVNFIISYLEKGSKILDVGCGYGRHSIRLAELGHQVTGIDASSEMIEIAKNDAREKKVKVDFLCGDIVDQGSLGEFDTALLVFSAFGYKTEDYDKQVFKSIFNRLKPRGLFIFDGRNRSTVKGITEPKKVGPETHWLEGKDWNMVHEYEDQERSHISMILYTPKEIEEVINDIGFSIIEKYSDYEKSDFTGNSDKFVFVVRKP